MSRIITKNQNDKYIVKNLDELDRWAQKFILELPGYDIVLLSGPLGVGKTALVKAIVAHLGSSSTRVQSPTYTLHNRYEIALEKNTSPQYFDKTLIVDHFDLYRVDSSLSLETTGIWEALAKSSRQRLVFIEWAEKISELPFGWTIWKLLLEYQ